MDDQLSEAVDPTVPHTVALAWRSLSYSVKRWSTWKMENKSLLSELNGALSLGSLNGLLGPSGAGKTTLLNCLAGNRKATPACPQVGASLFVNGSQLGASIDCVFIEQNIAQSILGSLTVRQILGYAYQFKNETSFTQEAAHCKVSGILQSLLLPEELLDRRFSHCSGGEQRRVAIAQELVGHRMPQFLFLDEPTTGLDSASAFEVVTCLQTLAHNFGLTVLASLHAPNHATLHLFDQIIVLARGGAHSIYSGPPAQIGPFIRKHLPEVDLAPEQLPIEVLIKIACNSDACNAAVVTLSSQTAETLATTLNDALPNLTPLPNGFPSRRKSFTCADFSTQLRRLFTFTFISQLPSLLYTLAGYLFICLFLASTTSTQNVLPSGCVPRNSTCQPDLEATSQLTANFNYLIISLHNAAFLILVSASTTFSPLVTVFCTEYRNRWYSLGTFFWSIMLISFFTILLLVLILCPVIYFASGQHLVDSSFSLIRYSHYLLCFALNALYGQAIGHFIGLLFLRFANLAGVSSILVYALLEIFSDFLFKSDESPFILHSIAADLVAVKYITKYLVYVFYGIDRCEIESEKSWMLANHYVNPNDIQFYLLRVVQNILLFKLATLGLLYFKFNDFSKFSKICQSQPTEIKLETEIILKRSPIEVENNNKPVVSCRKNDKSSEKNEILLSSDSVVNGKIILAFRHLTLYRPGSFFDISTSSSSQTRSPILRQVNGQFTFGSLNAVMGQSGAGKTSLLRVLNGQLKCRLSEQTEVYLSKYTNIQTAFITQDVSGHLMRGLTGRQLLVFASRLKNRGDEKVMHGEIAEKILRQLDLLGAGDTPAHQCSDGERKRLAVGLELTSLRMPNLLCIDEPTSGLDSNSAALVISTLRRLTRLHAMTIITSIHQPTMEVLYSFDQLYVLAPGGVAVYSGPPEGVKAYLQAAFHLPQEPLNDELDGNFYIEELISLSSFGHLDSRVVELEQTTQRSILSNDEALSCDTQLVPDGIQANRCRFSLTSTFIIITRYLAYIRAHLWKEWLAFIIITLFYGTVLICVFDPQIATVSGCINPSEAYLNLSCPFSTAEAKTEFRHLSNNYFFAFLLDYIFLIILGIHSILYFFAELPLFMNEQRNGWYSTGAFYLFKCLEILPSLPLLLLYLALTNIYSTVLPELYWQLVGLLAISQIAFQGMLQAIILLIRGNLTQTILVAVGVALILLQLSNLFIPHSGLHYVYQFLSNFTIVRFNWEAFMLLQYGFGRCAPDEIQPTLYSMGLTDEAFWSRIAMLIANLLFYRILAITLLLRKTNLKVGQKKRFQRIDQYTKQLQAVPTVAQGLFSFNGEGSNLRNVNV